jgi:hypothetical protein
VYSMVTSSPGSGWSLPLPGERTSFLNSEAMAKCGVEGRLVMRLTGTRLLGIDAFNW